MNDDRPRPSGHSHVEPIGTVPVVEEHVRVERREVDTAVVRIRKRVVEEDVAVDPILESQHVEVERRPVGEFVDEIPAVRREGDVLIIPCVEEVLVVEKRLRLREEVRVRTVREHRREHHEVRLRREEVEIERNPVAPSPTNE